MIEATGTEDQALDFLVNRNDLADCKLVAATPPGRQELRPGQVLMEISKFGLSSNNITYAVLGESLGYWKYFPAEDGWGRIPAWGFGRVMKTRHAQIEEGDRIYGYFPISTHHVAEFGPAAGELFVETSAHRSALPAVYNRYTRSARNGRADPLRDDLHVVLRPLFTTSWLLDDFLADNGYFGARTLVISSASSKTALGLAFLLSRRKDRPFEIVGLTAGANMAFVKRTGFFDAVLAYESLDAIPRGHPAVFVDMAGNGEVASAVHHHLAGELKYSCRVGLTHWNKPAREEALPGAAPALFFAPAQSHKRVQEWGAEEFRRRLDAAWEQLAEMAARHLDIVRVSGPASVSRVYRDLLDRGARPEQGHVLSWSSPARPTNTPLQHLRIDNHVPRNPPEKRARRR
ncbi:MAG TPA: DUF2855 family protein [Burkholderiaceae bacterium]|nr:DUF2855 family protein [Burkholderiaceae bacterium]